MTRTPVITPTSPWPRVMALVAIVTLCRLAYLAFASSYSLIEDEAFYWEWSLRPALSYSTKGPGIAWLIWSATNLIGISEFAVRAWAPVCSAVSMICVAHLAMARGTDSQGPADRASMSGAAWYAVVVMLCAPGFQVTSLLMTIDGPYVACWAVACVAAHRAMLARGRWAWIVLGASIGIGFLMKYTILVLPVSLILFGLTSRRRLQLTQGAGKWMLGGLALTALGTLPVIIWNSSRGWPTVAHLLGHLGLPGGDVPISPGANSGVHGGYQIWWTASFVLSQLGSFGAALFVLIRAMIRACRTAPSEQASEHTLDLYLAWCAGVLLAMYAAVSLFTEPEGNWTLAAYVTGSALVGRALARGISLWRTQMEAWRQLPEPRPWAGWFVRRPQSLARAAWMLTLVVGVCLAVATPLLEPISRIFPRIPVGRFTGGPLMGDDASQHLARLADDAQSRGVPPPFLIAKHYGRAAQLRFYMRDRPVVYCSGKAMGHGRPTQYDFWPDTDLRDPDLVGRDALVVGGQTADWEPFFEVVESPFQLKGDGKRGRPAFVCRGFKGLPATQTPAKVESP